MTGTSSSTEATPSEAPAALQGGAGVQEAPAAPRGGAEPTDWRAEAEKWKALSRKNEERAHSNAEKAKRLDELEEKSKSEMQKALERADAAEKRAAALEVQATRARVAAARGVDVDLLTGSTEEEITACADRLLAWRGESAPSRPPASTPATDAGARGDTVAGPKQYTREDLKTMTPKQINEARRAGHLDRIMGVS